MGAPVVDAGGEEVRGEEVRGEEVRRQRSVRREHGRDRRHLVANRVPRAGYRLDVRDVQPVHGDVHALRIWIARPLLLLRRREL